MISTHSFKLHRQHVEVVAGPFFRIWRLQMESKAKDLQGSPLEDELILWATWLEVMQELDIYFTARVKSTSKYEIKITLTMAQVLTLYRAVLHLQWPANDYFAILVRDTLMQHLFSFIIKLNIKVQPARRQQPALEDFDWDY